MSLFKPLEPPTHLKAGFFGFTGSGKTFTAVDMAIGLHKYIKSDKPILGIETETGLSFLKDKFTQANIPMNVVRTRAFTDLLDGTKEAIKEDSILIIDSITHFWQELMKSYLKKNNLIRLRLRDFIPLKDDWSAFPTLYLNSPCHIIMCGRAGYDWGEEEDSEEEGKKKLVKTGTKMKVESDFGYEPTLLIEMEQIRSDRNKIGSEFIHRAWVLKDKFDVIEGQCFEMPAFKNFLPHISKLAIGGNPPMIDTEKTSVDLISSDRGIAERLKQRDIFMEELVNELDLRFSTRTDDGKKSRLNWLKDNLGATSKTAIENMPNDKLKEALNKIRQVAITEKES